MQSPLPAVPPGGTVLARGPVGAQPAFRGYSDGSVKAGRATCAFVLYDDQGCRLLQRSSRLAEATRDSNVAELAGLVGLLEAALDAGVRSLVCLLDSYQALEALAKHCEGRPSRYPLVARAAALMSRFDYIELRNLANRLNRETDALCAAAR